MKNSQKGAIGTVLVLAVFALLGIATVTSSFLINKNKIATNSRASEYRGACQSDLPEIPAPGGFKWTPVDGCQKTCTDTTNHSDCDESDDPNVYKPTSKWCYGGFADGIHRCLKLVSSGSTQAAPANTNTAATCQAYEPPTSGEQPNCSAFVNKKIKLGNYVWDIHNNCGSSCTSNDESARNTFAQTIGNGKSAGEVQCFGFGDGGRWIVYAGEVGSCSVAKIYPPAPAATSTTSQSSAQPAGTTSTGTGTTAVIVVPKTSTAPAPAEKFSQENGSCEKDKCAAGLECVVVKDSTYGIAVPGKGISGAVCKRVVNSVGLSCNPSQFISACLSDDGSLYCNKRYEAGPAKTFYTCEKIPGCSGGKTCPNGWTCNTTTALCSKSTVPNSIVACDAQKCSDLGDNTLSDVTYSQAFDGTTYTYFNSNNCTGPIFSSETSSNQPFIHKWCTNGAARKLHIIVHIKLDDAWSKRTVSADDNYFVLGLERLDSVGESHLLPGKLISFNDFILNSSAVTIDTEELSVTEIKNSIFIIWVRLPSYNEDGEKSDKSLKWVKGNDVKYNFPDSTRNNFDINILSIK